jgi:hypothetical protein
LRRTRCERPSSVVAAGKQTGVEGGLPVSSVEEAELEAEAAPDGVGGSGDAAALS